ncbi:MAG: DUF1566 domain-containing protein [Desulfobulbaceae bacterium]|nr:DUF1566 domain-containing protein [Desulfobulbaceae bacterium]
MQRHLLWYLIGIGLLLAVSGCASPGGPGAREKGEARLAAGGDNICRDRATGLVWQVGTSGELASWQEANAYAAGLVLGGYDDWRLPDNDELYVLRYLFGGGLNGDCAMEGTGSYWSGESEGWGQVGYWEPYPICGGVDYKFVRTKSGVVRAVRP